MVRVVGLEMADKEQNWLVQAVAIVFEFTGQF